MASKKVEMYAKKRYELDEIKNKIKEEFDKHKFSDVEFKDEIIRELGDTKTLLLIFEILRTGSYASLVIMLSEYQDYRRVRRRKPALVQRGRQTGACL